MSINRMEALLRDLDSSINSLSVDDTTPQLASTASKTVADLLADTSALSGYLNLMGADQSWERRFFVLSSEGLHMFASSSATEPCQDKFVLGPATALTASIQAAASTPLAFELRDDLRAWILSAPTKTSKNAWIDMIQVLITKPTLSSSASIRSAPGIHSLDYYPRTSTELHRNDSAGDLRGYPSASRKHLATEYITDATGRILDPQERIHMLREQLDLAKMELNDQAYMKNMAMLQDQQRQYMQGQYQPITLANTPRSPVMPTIVSRMNSVSTSYSSNRDSTATSDSWYFQGSSPQSDFYTSASLNGSSINTHVRRPSVGDSINAGIPGGGIFGGADLERNDSKASTATAAWGAPSTKAVVDGLTLTSISSPKTESIKSDEKAPKKKGSSKAQVALAFYLVFMDAASPLHGDDDDASDALDDILAGYESDHDLHDASHPAMLSTLLSHPSAVSGFIHVRNPSLNDEFMLRFCVLLNGSLNIFESSNEQQMVLESMRVSQVRATANLPSHIMLPLAFEVSDESGAVWTMATPNKSSKNMWINLIQEHIPDATSPTTTTTTLNPTFSQPPLPSFKARVSSLAHTHGTTSSNNISTPQTRLARTSSMSSNATFHRFNNVEETQHRISMLRDRMSQLGAGGGSQRPYSEIDYLSEDSFFAADSPTRRSFSGDERISSPPYFYESVEFFSRASSPSFRSSTTSNPLTLQQHASVDPASLGGIPRGGIFGGLGESDFTPVVGRRWVVSKSESLMGQDSEAAAGLIVPKRTKSAKAHSAKAFVQF
ncbi:hypothetical protein HDU78_009021 [Chytriomyces hyalinus]|nr:hypothetical protein HDU78_009021 [Chytriomyces hyalinus]